MVELGAGDAISLINLADAEALTGNSESARFYYLEVIRMQEQEHALRDHRAMSQAYAQLGEHELAIAALKRMGENRRGNAEAHFNAALVYALAEQDIAAMVEVEQALEAGIGAIWFRLPWFDGLCRARNFEPLLAAEGLGGRCSEAPSALVNRQGSLPMRPPGSLEE